MTTYTLHDLRTDPRWALPERVERGTRCVVVDIGAGVIPLGTVCHWVDREKANSAFVDWAGGRSMKDRPRLRLAPPDYTGLAPDALAPADAGTPVRETEWISAGRRTDGNHEFKARLLGAAFCVTAGCKHDKSLAWCRGYWNPTTYRGGRSPDVAHESMRLVRELVRMGRERGWTVGTEADVDASPAVDGVSAAQNTPFSLQDDTSVAAPAMLQNDRWIIRDMNSDGGVNGWYRTPGMGITQDCSQAHVYTRIDAEHACFDEDEIMHADAPSSTSAAPAMPVPLTPAERVLATLKQALRDGAERLHIADILSASGITVTPHTVTTYTFSDEAAP